MSRTKLNRKEVQDAKAYFGDEVLEGRTPVGRWTRGSSGNTKGRPTEPDSLVDMLIWRLGKRGSKRLADHLIEMALSGSSQLSLQATTYIYDRIVGRPRQEVLQQADEEAPIVRLLRQLTDDKQALSGHALPPGRPAESVVTAEVREIDSGVPGTDPA